MSPRCCGTRVVRRAPPCEKYWHCRHQHCRRHGATGDRQRDLAATDIVRVSSCGCSLGTMALRRANSMRSAWLPSASTPAAPCSYSHQHDARARAAGHVHRCTPGRCVCPWISTSAPVVRSRSTKASGVHHDSAAVARVCRPLRCRSALASHAGPPAAGSASLVARHAGAPRRGIAGRPRRACTAHRRAR